MGTESKEAISIENPRDEVSSHMTKNATSIWINIVVIQPETLLYWSLVETHNVRGENVLTAGI